MLSRIFWVGIAGIALVTGMLLQDGDWIFGSVDRVVDTSIDQTVDRTVDQVTDSVVDQVTDGAIDGSVDRMQVVGADGREIDVSPQDKRAFANAIARLVEAEAALAVLKIRDVSGGELQAANARRDAARAEVDRLKAAIKSEDRAGQVSENDVRDQVRQEVREEIRTSVRDAVGN